MNISCIYFIINIILHSLHVSHDFRNEWIEQISAHQSKLIPVDEVEKHKIWFEYLFNEAEPEKSTYRCRLCFKYYDKFGLQKQHKNALADENGALRKYKYDNKKCIAEHANIPGHKAIVQTLQEKSHKRLVFFSIPPISVSNFFFDVQQ